METKSPSNTDDLQIGHVHHIVLDHLGSPKLIVDMVDNSVAEEINYDEFGNVTMDTNPGPQPFGFAGGLYDRDTKLVHFGAREYDASIGRWTTRDPIGFRGGDTNLYGYVLNDPINRIDPSGKIGIADGIAILAVVGVAYVAADYVVPFILEHAFPNADGSTNVPHANSPGTCSLGPAGPADPFGNSTPFSSTPIGANSQPW